MPRKSHRRRRKKKAQPVPTLAGNEPIIEPVRIMWRISVKKGRAWSIAYEGYNPGTAKMLQEEYKAQGYQSVIERI